MAFGRSLLFATTVLASPFPALAQTAVPPPPGVAAGEASGQDVQDIVVTGYRAALDAAQQAKREAPSVVEAITPEDLGKFSDKSIADELQRVPGVQIDRNDAGRSGDHVSIRGLGANFVQTTVNGRTPGSYGQEGLQELRSFPIDVMPSEVLSGVLIYKTSTAEQVEPGLGGSVDLQTLKPLDYKPPSGGDVFGSVTARGQKNSQANAGWGISGIVGAKLANDTLGIYVAGLRNRDFVNVDFLEIRPQLDTLNVRTTPGGPVTQQTAIFPSYPDFGRQRRREDRTAISTGAQWKPSDALEISADYTNSRYDRYDNRIYNTLQMDGGTVLQGVFEPGGVTIKNGAVVGLDFTKYTPPAGDGPTGTRNAVPYDAPLPLYYDNLARTQIGGLNLKWHGDRVRVNLDGSLNRMKALQDIYIYYVGNLYYPSYTGVNYTSVDGAPGIFMNGAPSFTDTSQYAMNSTFRRFIQNVTEGASVNGDVAYDVGDTLTLKAGARYSVSTVDVRSVAYFGSVTAAQSAALRPYLFPGGTTTIFPGDTIGINAQPIQDTRSAAQAVPSVVPALTTNVLSAPFADTINAPGPWAIDASRSFRVREATTALYAQADTKGELGGMAFEGNAGLRAVHTQDQGQAFQTTTYVDANNFPTRPSAKTLVRGDNDYWTFLPSVNVTLHPQNSINQRLGVGRTMSRAEFEQLAPLNVISVPDPNLPTTGANSRGTGTVGNPKLKPLTAWNFDTSLEYYGRDGASYVFSAFYKSVSNFVGYNTLFNQTVPGQGNLLFNVTTAINFSSGRVYGFEIGGNQPLDKLIGVKGFGLQGNFTFVDSKIDAPISGNSFAFPGSSKYNFNGTVYYSHGPLDLRVAYVYRSNYLSSLPWIGVVNFPRFTNGYGTLDASATVKVFKNIELVVTGSNLTEANRRDYLYNSSTFLNSYTRPRQVVGAVRVSF